MRAHVRAFLRSTPAAAHWSVAFVLLAWIIKAVWLDDIPAPFSAMVGLAKVSEGILSAYVAGYVFFVVFALLPEYRHRVELGDFLFTKVRHIIGDCSAVMMEIEKASGHGAPFATVTQKQIEAAFRATPAAYQPVMTWNGRQASIFNLLEDRQRRSLEAIQELFDQGRYLDPALVSLLQRVKGSTYFAMLRPVGYPLTLTDLSAWGTCFFKYLHACRQLRIWHNENRVPGVAKCDPEPR